MFTVGYGKTTGMPTDQYASLGSDKALIWWDGDTTGISQLATFTGKGLFRYMDNAKRYTYNDLPTTQPKFFADTPDAVYVTPVGRAIPRWRGPRSHAVHRLPVEQQQRRSHRRQNCHAVCSYVSFDLAVRHSVSSARSLF